MPRSSLFSLVFGGLFLWEPSHSLSPFFSETPLILRLPIAFQVNSLSYNRRFSSPTRFCDEYCDRVCERYCAQTDTRMPDTCIPLSGSTKCPAYKQSSVSTSSKHYTDLCVPALFNCGLVFWICLLTRRTARSCEMSRPWKNLTRRWTTIFSVPMFSKSESY